MKRIAMTLVAMCALITFSTQAKADHYGYRGSGYGGGYGYGQPSTYFGNRGHDLQPHMHVTQTPFSPNIWYGNGPHDLAPHQDSRTPWSYQGYSNTGAGPTTSFYNQQPTYYSPW